MKPVLCSLYAMTIAMALYAAPPATTAAAPATPAPAGEMKLAYVDTSEVVDRSLECKEFNREEQTKKDLKEEEAQKKMDELKKLREQMEALTDEKRKELMPQYERKAQELEDFVRQSRDEIYDRTSVAFKTIAQKVQRIIETLSRDMNLTLVIDAKAILFADKTKMTNLTDKVVEVLNAEYEKEREKLKLKVPARIK